MLVLRGIVDILLHAIQPAGLTGSVGAVGVDHRTHQRPSLLNSLEAITVVMARKSSWSRVTDTDELMGVLNFLSALPQYCGQHVQECEDVSKFGIPGPED